MNHAIIEQIVKANRKHTLRGIWRRIVTGLACVVVFCTVYALILPAITMKTEVFCGVEEHIHTNDCFRQIQSGEPTCGIAEEMAHVHGESCYAEPTATSVPVLHMHSDSCFQQVQGDLNCGLEETQGHQHGSDCYIPGENLICTTTENHQHVDTCFTYPLICQDETDEHVNAPECYSTEASQVCELEEMHVHTDSCYNSILVCELPEVEGHTHAEGCYLWHEETICEMEEGQPEPTEVPDPELICSIPEMQTHVHSDQCYESQFEGCTEEHVHTADCVGWQLICQQEVHEHQLICYSDPTADLETPAIWEKTFADVVLSGDTRKDLLEIARTQLGYHESTRNYTVGEDGNLHGYTRYGDWYGYPHGEWCAMFVSFCLNYADIHEIPYYAGVSPWVEKLTELDRYRAAGEFTPIPGDLIFFDWKQDGHADHVGIVAELIPATEIQKAQIKVLEGNAAAQVKYVYYDQDSKKICGFAVLPEKLNEEETAQLEAVRYLISALPDLNEIESKLTEFENALEFEQRDLWLAELTAKVKDVYLQYQALSENQLIYLENAQQLLDLESIWSAEDPARIAAVISLIDQLPSNEEVESALRAFEESEDTEGYEAYFGQVYWDSLKAYNAYQDLNESGQSQITNIDKLMELHWLWDATLYPSVNLSKVTYNPDYETDVYHIQWTTPGDWITDTDHGLIHINEAVPDAFTVEGLVIGGKSAESITFSKPEDVIIHSPMTDAEAISATGFAWSTLTDSGFDSTYGANILLPSDPTEKMALLGNANDPLVYALYKNIGSYNGHSVDLKISLEDYENYADWKDISIKEGILGFRTGGESAQQCLPGISVCGISWVQLNYEFLYSDTGEKINVYGSTSYYGLDSAQAVHFGSGLTGIYVTDVREETPDLTYVNSELLTAEEQTTYFENWPADDCVLKFSDEPPQGSGVVIYSPHGNDASQKAELLADTKHAFTVTFQGSELNITYSFDKGKLAQKLDANGSIVHAPVPVHTGSLEIRQETEGILVDPDYEYQFRIEFFAPSGAVDTTLNGNLGNVTLTEGIGTFTLKSGESVKITGIPIREAGIPFKITAENSDGSIVEVYSEDMEPTGQNVYTNTLTSDNASNRHRTVVFKHTVNSLVVEKLLTGVDGLMLTDPDFTFRILKANEDGTRTTESFIDEGVAYNVYDAATNELIAEDCITGQSGTFSIKSGQRAVFVGISPDVGKYYICEIMEPEFIGQYAYIHADGTDANFDPALHNYPMSAVKDSSVGPTVTVFESGVIPENLSSITVSKELQSLTTPAPDRTFRIFLELNGTPLTDGLVLTSNLGNQLTVGEGGYVELLAGESIAIPNLISATTFQVLEAEASSDGYLVGYTAPDATNLNLLSNGITGIIPAGTAVTVTVTGSEQGAQLEIPVVIDFQIFAEGTYESTFALTQTDANGDPIPGGTSLTLTGQVAESGASLTFDPITYLANQFEGDSATYYYTVEQTAVAPNCMPNSQKFLVEVLITRNEDGTITAHIQSVAEYLEGSPVTVADRTIRFTETVTSTLTLEMDLIGLDAKQEFGFIITPDPGESGLRAIPQSYLITSYDFQGNILWENVEYTLRPDGTLHMLLHAGERIVIQGLPVGAHWYVRQGTVMTTEAGEFTHVDPERPFGYLIGYQIGEEEPVERTLAGGWVTAEDTHVIFINTTTYMLPKSGGMGTTPYTTGGLLLTAAAVILLYIQKRRRREGS